LQEPESAAAGNPDNVSWNENGWTIWSSRSNRTVVHQLGQHRLRSGPRWYPGGQALPLNIGWHAPPGPRQNPRPHPSATLITELFAAPAGAGVTAALAAVARPNTNALPKKSVRIILYPFLLGLSRYDLPTGPENQRRP